MRRVSLDLFSIGLLFFVSSGLAQPVWQPGYPALRVETNGLGIQANLDVQSRVYFVVYNIDPGVSPTAAQVKAATCLPSSGNVVRTGNVLYGDEVTRQQPRLFYGWRSGERSGCFL